MAAANAQAVLNAQADAAQAVRDAEAAQMAAESALADAMALDDSATKTGLVAALEAAVEYAKSQVEAAEAAINNNPMDTQDPPQPTTDVDSLAEAVAAVTGGEDADPQGTPKSIGEGVAMQVAMALLPQADLGEGTPDGTATRVTHYTGASGSEIPADAPAIADRTFHDDNSGGMTWAEIVGDANVMDVRRFVTGTGITQVKAMSVMGSMGSDLTATGVTLPADEDTAADGIQNNDGTNFDAMYMGIDGTVFCAGNDCGQDADGNLTGSWYFTPDSTTTIFISNPDATARATTPYVADTGYVQWGHWLIVDTSGGATDGEVTVHTYATTAANIENLNVGVATGCDPECSAMYSGSAAGMSVHKTFDGNAKQLTIDSGAFTADVELTARFGSRPCSVGESGTSRAAPTPTRLGRLSFRTRRSMAPPPPSPTVWRRGPARPATGRRRATVRRKATVEWQGGEPPSPWARGSRGRGQTRTPPTACRRVTSWPGLRSIGKKAADDPSPGPSPKGRGIAPSVPLSREPVSQGRGGLRRARRFRADCGGLPSALPDLPPGQ